MGTTIAQTPLCNAYRGCVLNPVSMVGTVTARSRHHPPRLSRGLPRRAAGEIGRVAHDILVEWRAGGHAYLRDRFQRAVEEGDLPAGSDPDLIARYVMTIGNGIAVRAAGGATREDLQRVADAALRNWPPA